jgi:hypothetical protein
VAGNVSAGADDELEQAGSTKPIATRDVSANELLANRIIDT